MKKIMLLAVLLLLWAGEVRAQCTGYSATITPAALAPGDVAARGGVTMTTYVTPMDGSLPSHRVSIGINTTTRMLIHYNANNTTSVTFYNEWDGTSNPTFWFTASGTSGSFEYDSYSGWPVGHVLNIIAVATGNAGTSRDVIPITTTNQAAGFYSQDGLPTNAYIAVTINVGGGSMLNNCSPCNTGNSQQCINATHTPYVTMTAVNHTSGESQSLPRQQAGNIAKSNESVSGTGTVWISALPGDTVDGTANAEIFCTMFGDLPVSGNDDWGLDWELAWTKFSTIQSSCLPAGGNPPSIGCKVTSKYMCNTNSQPADLQVNQVFAEYDTNGNPVTLETVPPFWWGWGFGIRGKVAGFITPWIFPANVLQQYKVGDMSSFAHVVLEIAAGAFPSNSTIRQCTNKDLGKGPETFPPLDQP